MLTTPNHPINTKAHQKTMERLTGTKPLTQAQMDKILQTAKDRQKN